MESQQDKGSVRVWDLPTRLFKWTLVVLVVFQVVTGKMAGDWLVWHFRCGYAILALLIFRILWGFVGSTTSRFSDFVRGPFHGLAHLRALFGGGPPRETGHNAVGGWMVIALILALLVQVASGLFAEDDLGMDGGPLMGIAGEAWVKKMTSLHHGWINMIYILVGVHVLAAILYLFVKKQNLIGAMITGRKKRDDVVMPGATPPTLRFAGNGRALGCLVLAAAITWGIVRIGG
jgi:cytochrome b